MSEPPRLLSIDDILTLHAIAMEDQGGDPALRDRGLLESAIAMPAQQFGGQYLHEDIPAMAAAYAFHICKNHPFLETSEQPRRPWWRSCPTTDGSSTWGRTRETVSFGNLRPGR